MPTMQWRSPWLFLVLVLGWSPESPAAPLQRKGGSPTSGGDITEGLPELLTCLHVIATPLGSATQLARIVEQNRPSAEEAAKNLFEIHESLGITRGRLLSIPLGLRHEQLQPWLQFWDREVPEIIKFYD